MQTSKQGKAEIGSYEGVILTPYLDDVNVKTVGLGATSSDIPDLKSWPWNKQITIEQVIDLFNKSIVKYENAVNVGLKVTVEQHQFDALVSFIYNLGTGMIKGSLFNAINANADIETVCRLFEIYNRAGGRVVKGLTERREDEALLYREGVYARRGIADFNKAHPVSHKEIITGKTLNLLDYF